jgi:hypothetical protein
VTDCFVVDGFGVFDQAGQISAAQWYDAGVAGISTAEKARLEVAECPVGRYSDSQNRRIDTAARCVTCPAGSVTEETGSTDVTQCTGEVRRNEVRRWLHGSMLVCCWSASPYIITSMCSGSCHGIMHAIHALKLAGTSGH